MDTQGLLCPNIEYTVDVPGLSLNLMADSYFQTPFCIHYMLIYP